VPAHMRRHGILRIDVNECEVRALIAGDLDALKIHSDELPTPEMACAAKRHEAGHDDGKHGCACGLHGHHDEHGMHGCHHMMMGWGHEERDKAVLLLAVERPGDHPY